VTAKFEFLGGFVDRSELRVELWPLERVVPYARNARVISKSAIEKVAASIKRFGFRQPIVVDRKGVIVVGHARRMCCNFGGGGW